MSAMDVVQAVTSGLASIASIVAAIKAWRAELTSKKTDAAVAEVKNTLTLVLTQRQVQNVNVNVQTRAEAKGGQTIDASPEDDPRSSDPVAQGR